MTENTPDDKTDEVILMLRKKIGEVRNYVQTNEKFRESLKTMEVEYVEEEDLLIVYRTGYPELAVRVAISEDASEQFGSDNYLRLLGMVASYEYDTQIEFLSDPRINAPYPNTLQ